MSDLFQVITGPHLRQALEMLDWDAETLAEHACVSVVEVEKVLDDDAPFLNAVINCVRAVERAGIEFVRDGGKIVARRN